LSLFIKLLGMICVLVFSWIFLLAISSASNHAMINNTRSKYPDDTEC